MSKKGDQNKRKHGGAHDSTHVSVPVVKRRGSIEVHANTNLQKPTILLTGPNGSQDGGDVITKQSELEALIEHHADELVSSFGTEENAAEWITTTVDELGNIIFSGSQEDDPLGLSNSEQPNVKPNVAIFDPDSITSTSSNHQNFTESIISSRIKIEGVIGAKSSPCSPVSSLMKTEGSTGGGGGRQRSFSDSEEQLTAQDRACLEEIERGSQLTLEDQELIEDSKQRLRLELQDFDTTATDKSSSLMTAQELQSLQERGLDFDGNDESNCEEDREIAASSVASVNPSQITEAAINSSSAQITTQHDPALATISITTNKKENSTEIIIDTKTGKQVYQLNTADLNQAGSQPLTLVGEDGSLQKIYLEGMIDNMDNVPGTSVVKSAIPKKRAASHGLSKDDKGLYSCEECGISFAKPSKLRLHMMTHTGEKPFQCSEPGCDWAFTTAYRLKRHEESHQGKKEFACTFEGCERHFTTIYNLHTHLKMHERPLSECCPLEGCGQGFSSKQALGHHLRTHGEAGKAFVCRHPGCGMRFYSELSMGSHVRIHQRVEPLVCQFEGCGREFAKPSRLKAHLRVHTGERPYVCSLEGCAWAFNTASKLQRHVAKHTGARRYPCTHPGCNKAFMRKEHLKGHLVVHSKIKPFSCSVEGCPASFTAKSSWYVHVKKHEMRKDSIVYYCPIDGCVRKYKDKVGLRAHIDKHYGKTDEKSKADTLALVGDLSSLLPSRDELQQSLASIMDPPTHPYVPDPVTEVPDTPMSPPPGTSLLKPLAAAAAVGGEAGGDGGQTVVMGTQEMLEESPAGLVVNTVDGPAFVTYADLIASGVDLSAFGLVPQTTTAPSAPAAVSVQEPIVDLDPTPDPLEPTPLPPPTTTVIVKKERISAPVSASSSSSATVSVVPADIGCARTDSHRNHVMSDRARQRRLILKHKAATLAATTDDQLNLTDDLSLSSAAPPSSVLSLDPAVTADHEDLLSTSSSSSSQQPALSMRDPETGAIYVQTQLLQDDPPDDFPEDLSGGGGGLLQDAQLQEAFTGSTINLQDLAEG